MRYLAAINLLLSFWASFGCEPTGTEDVGEAVENFIEYLYLEAVTLKKANDCVSALVFLFPKLGYELRMARKMIRLWQSEEPPEKPVAITPLAVLGMAGLAAAMNLPGVAAILLSGFDGFLRSGKSSHLR